MLKLDVSSNFPVICNITGIIFHGDLGFVENDDQFFTVSLKSLVTKLEMQTLFARKKYH